MSLLSPDSSGTFTEGCNGFSPGAKEARYPKCSSRASAARLIERVLSGRGGDFLLDRITKDHERDVFTIESCDGKILLCGNNGVSISSALNYYLKEYCKCDISWNCGNQLGLPDILPEVLQAVHVASPHNFRFAYNFCTHGYTMAWWQWPEWEREIDFLALNGVNLALVLQGLEMVWIETFVSLGYTPEEVRSWLVLPTHQPWMYMGNLEQYGEGISESIVENRLQLGKKIVNRMRELGIEAVLPGYYGMVPPDFKTRFPKTRVFEQGQWCALRRPDILDPTDSMFLRVANAYYESVARLFGIVNFFAADPFHEGGNTSGLDIQAAARAIQRPMRAAVWVLQSWQNNPRQELVEALDRNNVLVLDLWCESRENWRKSNSFHGAPWLWCTIHNFGGNVGLGGRLELMAEGPAAALQDPRASSMSGIGALLEGGGTCPALWEYFFENAWRKSAPNLDIWLKTYCARRYGVESLEAALAWNILANTVYAAPAYDEQLPVNSVVTARPSLDPGQRAREWAPTDTYYDVRQLAFAWGLLLNAASEAGASDGFRFDLVDVGRQVLADLGTLYHARIVELYRAGELAGLSAMREKLLNLILDMDLLTGTRPELLFGSWQESARSWGQTDGEKDRCERAARELLTVWTRGDTITDYANRQWSGLLVGFYYRRWDIWLSALAASVEQGVVLDEACVRSEIKEWEIAWTKQTDRFPAKAAGDAVALSQSLYRKYSDELLHI